MVWEQVISIDHLIVLCDINGKAEFCITLCGGLCRSSKEIHFDNLTRKFEIYNDIDETWQSGLTVKDLYTETMIPEAIEKCSMFYCGHQLWGI
jgi:hypothetical protein